MPADERADERADILAAMDRLLEGIPLRSDGKLTIVALAIEAGVKRHVLTHKHTDLRDRFNARVKARAQPADSHDTSDRTSELLQQLSLLRLERDNYRHAAEALARALNVVTIENDNLRRHLARTHQHTQPAPRAPAPLTALTPLPTENDPARPDTRPADPQAAS